jgi:hypothetical protein
MSTWLGHATFCPELRSRKTSGNGGPPRRPAGAPLLLRLRLFATRELSAADPFDLLLAELLWLWVAHFESEGTLSLVGDSDFGFRAWCDEQDKKRAGAVRN